MGRIHQICILSNANPKPCIHGLSRKCRKKEKGRWTRYPAAGRRSSIFQTFNPDPDLGQIIRIPTATTENKNLVKCLFWNLFLVKIQVQAADKDIIKYICILYIDNKNIWFNFSRSYQYRAFYFSHHFRELIQYRCITVCPRSLVHSHIVSLLWILDKTYSLFRRIKKS